VISKSALVSVLFIFGVTGVFVICTPALSVGENISLNCSSVTLSVPIVATTGAVSPVFIVSGK
jgi:hypothetical protein